MKIRFNIERGSFVCHCGNKEVVLKSTTFKDAVTEAFEKNLYPSQRSGNVSTRRKAG